MSRARWPVATLFLVATTTQAAEGTHPGPLPEPVETAPRPAATDRSYPAAPEPGAALRYGQDAAAGYGPGWRGAPAGDGHGYGGGYAYPDYGQGPPPTPGGQDRPRGYWIWVPAEAAESLPRRYPALESPGVAGYGQPYPGDHGYGRGGPAYFGYPEAGGYGAPVAEPPFPPFGGEGADYPAPGRGWWGDSPGGN